MPQKWDLIVLGGGPAGYVGAARAARAGLATLLIEQNALGGVCLNEGCIPSKTLLYSAKLADGVRQGAKYGVVGQAQIDHAAVIKRKDKVVRTLTAGIRAQMKAAGVTVLMATGEIAGRDAQGLIQVRTGDEIHLAQNLLIATGSSGIAAHCRLNRCTCVRFCTYQPGGTLPGIGAWALGGRRRRRDRDGAGFLLFKRRQRGNRR